MKSRKFTLITGASSGLGKELAHECAKRGRNLVLTALPNEQINILGNKLSSAYGVEIATFETDFTKENSVFNLSSSIKNNFEIDMLINNAGMGGTRSFIDASPEYIDHIVLLNMRALVLLTRLLLPTLKKNKQAFILNIASMASFGPMPFKTVYPASKAFVYSFSRGLGSELKGSGISVSVAHPGGMKTNAEVTRRIEKHGKLIQATTLSSKKVAHICIRQTLKCDEIIIPGFMNKLCWLILKLVPVWLKLKIMRTSLKKELRIQQPIIESV